MKPFALASLALALFTASLSAADDLRVVKAGPAGEIASLAEANEIRIVFSEPMVALGRIPQPVKAPFFSVTPSIPGTFRWSGTTTLIFTPDSSKPLPYATTYKVTLSASTAALGGDRLGKPFSFSFTTPAVKLLQTNWYRKGGIASGPVVIALRFNQPIDPQKVSEHLRLSYVPHKWKSPQIPKRGIEFLKENDPSALAAFEKKVAATAEVARASKPLFVFLAETWDKKRFPPAKDLVVLETRPDLPPDGWIRLLIDKGVPAVQGPATPASPQEFIIKLPSTLFVDGFECSNACDPEQWNPLRFRARVHVSEARKRTAVVDVTDPRKPVPLTAGSSGKRDDEELEWDQASQITLEDLGFAIEPAHTYRVTVDPALRSVDGQQLGYKWAGVVEFWHKSAFTSFGDGHGVWEASGGPQLPFYARNIRNVTQWLKPLTEAELVPTIVRLQEQNFALAPDGAGRERTLSPVPDKIQSYGVAIDSALNEAGRGLLWAAVKDGHAIPDSHLARDSGAPRATVVQVTNLGVSVKDSPLNTLIFVTRLDNAAPVAGAKVTIRTTANKVFWSGVTDRSGIALAPNTPLRLPSQEEIDKQKEEQPQPQDEFAEFQPWFDYWNLKFVVTAEKDGDVAYLGSDWTQGIEPWMFDLNYDLYEAKPLLRGQIFSDRGVYKPGEDAHLKAILRSDTPAGIELLPASTEVKVRILDAIGKTVDTRSVSLNQWSTAEWVFHVPESGSLGGYQVQAKIDGQRNLANGAFLVAAYRRPDFRVDVSLSSKEQIAGARADGTITARYLFGAPMASRPVSWTWSKSPLFSAPAAVTEHFPDRYTFVGRDWTDETSYPSGPISKEQATLDTTGALQLQLPTEKSVTVPYSYTLEGNVEDISRQTIANRASLRVHPAPWYLGIRNPPFFVEAKTGLDTDVVAVTPEGLAAPSVPVTVTLDRIQWNSVRRAEGNGFYTWETERKKIEQGSWKINTTASAVPLHVDIKEGGYYILTAKASDDTGHSTRTVTSFYALGAGYTAWQRYDHNRIDLIPEKKTYKPGQTSRIMIQSPWESATALLTVEREGVRTSRVFDLHSTQETVSVPITEKDIPNVYVSVLLVKGRTKAASDEDSSDPGKPSFRLGYTELKVEDDSKRLEVDVTANRQEYRPGTKAKVKVEVHDHQKKPVRSEVTLWAVDYGVLSLTNYQTPDILGSIYIDKALQVQTEDSRQRIISRRVLTPKGADEGGGGGRDAGAEAMRKDFRPLAFWLGSVETDRKGRATATVTLPDSLTTYRIMAVAGDRQSRFGSDDSEIRVNKPLLLKQAFPRFLALGDKALFGSVVHSQLSRGGKAVVTMKSLDPSILEITGPSSQEVSLQPNASAEVRFHVVAKAVGDVRIQTTVKMLGESDAFEDVLPVRVLSSPEVVAAYGQTESEAKEALEIPDGVVPSIGGLHLEVASTAMVGLAEGARFLVEYPYGCAEQRSSRGLAIILASDLGEAFALPGIDPRKTKEAAQKNLIELEKFQCANGGFAYWPGDCLYTSPYLTSYVLHVFQVGKRQGFTVTPEVLERGYTYLEQVLNEERPENEGWWPAYTAWQAYAVKVLLEGGRNEDSHFNRLYGYLDRMPVFALSYLYDAMQAKGEAGSRKDELRRRIYNGILPEGGTSHVEELSDPYLLWFWNSNIRSTAIVLRSLLADGDPALVRGMVRWLMKVRKNGRWGNTQENALAMEALVAYYHRYETDVPDFSALVDLGDETLVKESFRGRSTEAKTTDVPMSTLLRKPAGSREHLVFRKEGTGTLFYMSSLKYASLDLFQKPLDSGFQIERSYEPHEGSPAATKSFAAGDLVDVVLTIRNTKERRYVAVTDPLPAGFEPVDSMFATTTTEIVAGRMEREGSASDWTQWWRRGGFDHVERHDDHVNLFATRLSEGKHVYRYVARATTSGTFRTAPTHIEEMYEPEVFGRGATDVVTVTEGP